MLQNIVIKGEKVVEKITTLAWIIIETYPVRNFFEIRRYFSKIARNSADTVVNALRTTDAPLS